MDIIKAGLILGEFLVVRVLKMDNSSDEFTTIMSRTKSVAIVITRFTLGVNYLAVETRIKYCRQKTSMEKGWRNLMEFEQKEMDNRCVDNRSIQSMSVNTGIHTPNKNLEENCTISFLISSRPLSKSGSSA